MYHRSIVPQSSRSDIPQLHLPVASLSHHSIVLSSHPHCPVSLHHPFAPSSHRLMPHCPIVLSSCPTLPRSQSHHTISHTGPIVQSPPCCPIISASTQPIYLSTSRPVKCPRHTVAPLPHCPVATCAMPQCHIVLPSDHQMPHRSITPSPRFSLPHLPILHRPVICPFISRFSHHPIA